MGFRIIAKNLSLNAFHKFGIVGYITAILTSMILIHQLRLSLWVIAIVSLVAAFGFFFLNMVIKIGLKRENIVYYHHEIFILFLCGVVLFLLKLPVWRYLDVIIIAIGVFLFWGRMGCFAVGCCHGRLSTFGCIYKETAQSQYIAPAYIGYKIFPMQILESIFVLILVSFLIFLVPYSKPGFILLLYNLFYGVYRFLAEFYRGDTDRPYIWGISEAQFTSLILLTISCWVVSYYSTFLFNITIFFTSLLWIISFYIIWNNRKYESILSAKSFYLIFKNVRNLLNRNTRYIHRKNEKVEINNHTQLSLSDANSAKILTLTQRRTWIPSEIKAIHRILNLLYPKKAKVQIIKKEQTVHFIFNLDE